MTRIFHTVHWLTPKDQEKVRQDRRNAIEGPVEIKYRKKRCVEDVDLGDGNHNQAMVDWALRQHMILAGITPPVFTRYVTVFGACEAKDGACLKKLEDAWNAEQMELLEVEP